MDANHGSVWLVVQAQRYTPSITAKPAQVTAKVVLS